MTKTPTKRETFPKFEIVKDTLAVKEIHFLENNSESNKEISLKIE